MQSYTEIASSTLLSASLSPLLNNTKTVMSNSSGTAFPTTNLQVGMGCFRTDTNELYVLKSTGPSVWVAIADVDYTKVDKEYVDTQLGTKQATITGGATTITSTDLTASRALVSDGSGKVSVAATTAAEVGYLAGVTSALQTQLDGKSATGHTHSLATTSANGFMSAADKTKLDGLGASFPTGTAMLFNQTSAPTGWTKSTAHNNKALRVVSGTVGSGGSNAFTTVFGAGKVTGSTSLSVAQMASHNHSVSRAATSGSTYFGTGGKGPSTQYVNNTGSGSSHNHSLTMDLQYVDLIIATKD